MKLSYRGIRYEQEPLMLEIEEGDIGGKYRGQDWHYHYPRHIPQLYPKHRQYRGVAYSNSSSVLTPTMPQACPIPKTQPTKIVTDEVTQVHLETIRRQLERRLESAIAKGDQELVQLLQQESQALKLDIAKVPHS